MTRSEIKDRLTQLRHMKGHDASDVWIIRSEIAWLERQLPTDSEIDTPAVASALTQAAKETGGAPVSNLPSYDQQQVWNALAAGARSDETPTAAQSEGRQSGPNESEGNAQ